MHWEDVSEHQSFSCSLSPSSYSHQPYVFSQFFESQKQKQSKKPVENTSIMKQKENGEQKRNRNRKPYSESSFLWAIEMVFGPFMVWWSCETDQGLGDMRGIWNFKLGECWSVRDEWRVAAIYREERSLAVEWNINVNEIQIQMHIRCFSRGGKERWRSWQLDRRERGGERSETRVR